MKTDSKGLRDGQFLPLSSVLSPGFIDQVKLMSLKTCFIVCCNLVGLMDANLAGFQS